MTRCLIPEFILRKAYKKEYCGSFEAWVMHVDLLDFSSLCTRLMSDSDRGAEHLSEVINAVFDPATRAMEHYGGFIDRFAGDAFVAIFPIANPDSWFRALCAACQMRDIVLRQSPISISSRIGMAKGKVSWKILPNPSKYLYWFSAACIREAIALQESALPNQILLKARHLNGNQLSRLRHEQISEGLIAVKAIPHPATALCLHPLRMSCKAFISEDILRLGLEGEFREVLSIFINFRKEQESALDDLIRLCQKYGGYLNKVFNSSQGLMALVLFGAPTAFEDIVLRAFRFANELTINNRSRIRLGMSLGLNYTGFIGSIRRSEYTAMGLSVNLAARLCLNSSWGKICFEESLLNGSAKFIRYSGLGQQSFKGFDAPLTCYVFEGIIEDTDAQYLSPFMGRDHELKKLQDSLETTLEPGIVYVYGDPGTGKSRLLYEYSQSRADSMQLLTLQCDGILQTALHPFIFFVKKQFNGLKSGSQAQRRQNFQSKFQSFLQSAKPKLSAQQHRDLSRAESVLAGLIALDWEGSSFRGMSAGNKAKAIQDAILCLFEAYLKLKPTILIVEDIQWLDSESSKILQSLATKLRIVCSSRYHDDGSIHCLDSDARAAVIQLEPWTAKQIKPFAAMLLQREVSESLAVFLEQKCLGNLFCIEQLCDNLLANDLLEEIDGLLHIKDTATQLSTGINALLMARIDRLDRSMKDAIHAASVLGNEFTGEVLHELLLRSQAFSEELSDPRELLENGRKIRLWNMLNEVSYSFSHGLLRDTAYDMQLGKELKKLHRLAAEIMVDYWREDKSKYSEIAAHFLKAELYQEATEYYRLAGEWAKDLYLEHEALNMYNLALEIIRDKLQKADKSEATLLMAIGVLYYIFGKYDLALGFLRQSEKLYLKTSGPDSLSISSCYGNLGTVMLLLAQYDDALRMLNKGLAIMLAQDNPPLNYIATAYSNIAQVHSAKLELELAEQNYLKGFAIEEQLYGPEHPIVGRSLSNLADHYCNQEQPAKARELIDRALSIFQNYPNTHYQDRTNAFTNAGRIYSELELAEQSLAFYEESIRIGKEGLGPRHPDTVVSMFNIAQRYLGLGDYHRALEMYKEVEDVWLETLGDKHPWLALCRNSIGKAHLGLGNYQTGYDLCSKALQTLQESQGTEHPWCEIIAENIAYAKEKLEME